MIDTLRKINRAIAIAIGVGLLICVALVLADVILRKLGSSFGGTDEISGYVMAVTTSWGMGLALLELAHVRIDVTRTRIMTAKSRTALDLFSLAVLSGVVTLVAFKCWPVLERSLTNGSRANTPLETPLWLVQIPWMAGWAWFAATCWLTLSLVLGLWLKGNFEAAEHAAGTFTDEGGG